MSAWDRETWELLQANAPQSYVHAFKWRYEECLRGVADPTTPWTVEQYAGRFANVQAALEAEARAAQQADMFDLERCPPAEADVSTDAFFERVKQNAARLPAERFTFLTQLPPDWFARFCAGERD